MSNPVAPCVDVIIITYNSEPFVRACIESACASTDAKVRTIVVDNNSTDGTVEIIRKEYPSVRLIRNNENKGYARAVNIGVNNSTSDFFIIVNADTVFHANTAAGAVEYLTSHQDVGIVGVQEVFPNGSWQRSYGVVPGIWESIRNLTGITSFHSWQRRLRWPGKVDKNPKCVGFVNGAFMAIKKAAFESVNGFDEEFFFYGEESDFCLRLKRSGWKVVFLPNVEIVHARGGSYTETEVASGTYSRLLSQSKILIARKRGYSKWRLSLYMHLERIHAKKMEMMYLVMRAFSNASSRAHYSDMASSFKAITNLWAEQLRKV